MTVRAELKNIRPILIGDKGSEQSDSESPSDQTESGTFVVRVKRPAAPTKSLTALVPKDACPAAPYECLEMERSTES